MKNYKRLPFHVCTHEISDTNIHIARNELNAYFLLLPSYNGSNVQARKNALAYIEGKAKELGISYYRIFKCNCNLRPFEIDYSSISNTQNIEYSTIYKFNYNGAVAINFNGLTDITIPFLIGKAQKSDIEDGLNKKSIDELIDERSSLTTRDPKVKETAKERDRYRCSIPGCPNKFEGTDGHPFVEVHHIQPLNEGGGNELSNVICLCSHHHSQVHYANEEGRRFVEDAIHDAMKEKLNRDYP